MRASTRRLLSIIAWLIATLVTLQAALIGQTIYGSAMFTGLHGGLGHLVLLLAVVLAVGAWIARAPGSVAFATTILFALVIAQIGLGYAGARSGIAFASSLHLPAGVLIAVIAAASATRLTTHPVDAVAD
jgi:hypothetical protein